ncbi:MAG: hypothetical protein WCG25_07445 [bacterium]
MFHSFVNFPLLHFDSISVIKYSYHFRSFFSSTTAVIKFFVNASVTLTLSTQDQIFIFKLVQFGNLLFITSFIESICLSKFCFPVSLSFHSQELKFSC